MSQPTTLLPTGHSEGDRTVVNERTRHALYQAVCEALGDEPAETLMEMLPPVGWADVATRHDLAALESTLQAELKALEFSLRADLRGEINRLVFWLIPILLAYGAALVRLG